MVRGDLRVLSADQGSQVVPLVLQELQDSPDRLRALQEVQALLA